jgi:transposase
MSGKRYSEEFKIEAVRQVTDRGYKVSEVAAHLGITTKSLYEWIKRYGDEQAQHLQISEQQREIRRLKAALRRAEEERDILKKAAKYFAGESGSGTPLSRPIVMSMGYRSCVERYVYSAAVTMPGSSSQSRPGPSRTGVCWG